LPHWEQTLLQHATFVNKPGRLEALRVAQHLFLASDGGAANSKGSFGAVVANADTIFLECGGRAYGDNPRSFLSEGYGMLAILCLLFHVRYFYWTRNRTLRFTLLCDSKSLIDRLEASRALTRPAPRRHLFSKADVEMQILSAMYSLGTVALEHVLGHQDDNDDGKPLSWEAQLNQHCDELATDHLSSATEILPLVPFLPASKVGLTVQGTTLTHHLPTQLRTFAGFPEYREYLCRHHGWEPEVFDLIDWPIFHASTLTLSFLKRLFVIKWINDLLPFQEQQNKKFHQSPSPRCPSSCGAHENWVHFLRCPHPARLIVWKECQTTMAHTLDIWRLDPSLRRLILYWLAKLMDSPAIPLDNLQDEYAMLKTTQETIGVDSVMLGYFTTDWVRLQHCYLVAHDLPHSHDQASRAIKAIILQLLEKCHECWLLWNAHLHGTNPRATCSYKQLHLLAQVTELYESAPYMLAADRDIFEIPLEARQNQAKSTLQAFYSWAKSVVALSMAKAREMGTHFRSIDQYFRPRIPQELFDVILG
jgi:hypothetical protein